MSSNILTNVVGSNVLTWSSQIIPSNITPGTNGQVLGTVAGVTQWTDSNTLKVFGKYKPTAVFNLNTAPISDIKVFAVQTAHPSFTATSDTTLTCNTAGTFNLVIQFPFTTASVTEYSNLWFAKNGVAIDTYPTPFLAQNVMVTFTSIVSFAVNDTLKFQCQGATTHLTSLDMPTSAIVYIF